MGKRIEVLRGITLLEAGRQAGFALRSECGGKGTCGKCRIHVIGNTIPPTKEEERILSKADIKHGQRLACRTRIERDIRVYVPPESIITGQRLQTDGDSISMGLEPVIHVRDIDMATPALNDVRSDLQRVVDALSKKEGIEVVADVAVVRQIATLARKENWHITTYLRDLELIGVSAHKSPALGLAIDLGTTKIAGFLMDLATGEQHAAAGVLNPQISFGEDVMSRLAYSCENAHGSKTLGSEVRKVINSLIDELASQTGVSRTQVADICIVGNTAMTHLLLQLPVRQLALSPYVAATNSAVDIKARDLDVDIAPGAYVHILPCIGGFVGADHVAMILASNLDCSERVAIGIDIGTNTEIVLMNPKQKKMASASCASGPAFEGAHIHDGMRAAAGAIEAVTLMHTGATVKTIDNKPAVGLCGSGIVDVVAELLRKSLINGRGRFQVDNDLVRIGRFGPEIVLVPSEQSGNKREIIFTQEDVNEIQLAKGAIRAGLEVLLKTTSTAPEDVEDVVVAGAFGSFLNIDSAIHIGLFPCLPNAVYRQVGNAAGIGAKQALLSAVERKRAQQISLQTDYIELTTFPEFNRYLAHGMLFGSP